MEVTDLKIGQWYSYDDGLNESNIPAKVVSIDMDKRIVNFIDDTDFEWDEPFGNIKEVVKKELK